MSPIRPIFVKIDTGDFNANLSRKYKVGLNGTKIPNTLHEYISASGALARFRKGTISFVMSVRPSVRMEQLGFHWTDFDEI